MAMFSIPSFLEDNLPSTVIPLDDSFYHSGGDHCYIHEAEVILQEPFDPMEPVNSSFVSPVTLQPSISVPQPIDENTTHFPHGITNPGYIDSDTFQAHSVTSEMPHFAYSDPLLIEMERIEKMNEEAFNIHEKKILQLQSDYKKEFEELGEKYRMLLQNVNTAVELKRRELETQCKLVLMNKVLAEHWIQKLDGCKRSAEQYTEQGMCCP
ncbi:Helicase protein MOM1 [Sesbania bispinosa]|nr:Helicase protein MOM1 [Sesbania bispinosa]